MYWSGHNHEQDFLNILRMYFVGVEVVAGWPNALLSDEVNLGQISGIATDSGGHVHLFHRGTHVWDYR
jgi:hypothetical protein